MIDNTAAYQTVGWILDHSDNGFFSLIASEAMQRRVVGFYKNSNVAVYDYLSRQEEYTFQALEDWIASQPDKDAYFLLNFQRALSDEEVLKRLNFSRDMLWKLNKNIIFCMTKGADDLLNGKAYDFYSYMKLVVVFQDELAAMREAPPIKDMMGQPQGGDESPEPVIENYGQWPEERQLAYAISLSNQAELLTRKCRYADARRLLEAVLSIRTAVLGGEHPDTARTYDRIAGVYRAQGWYDKALEYCRRALEVREETLGHGHPNIGATYNNMAGAYKDQGQYDKALECYEKALAITEKALGSEHPNTAAVYNNMAGAYEARGEYGKALEYYEEALNIKEKALPPEHPDLGAAYNNIAGVYMDQGEYGRALEYYEKALTITEKALGAEHRDTGTAYNNIAGVYEAQGEYEKALEYYEKALAIREKVLGPGHPNTGASYNNIGSVYKAQGEYVKALEY